MEIVLHNHFFCFRPEIHFGQICQKIKIVSLSQNFVPILIRIRRIQMRFRWETPFSGKLGLKYQN